MKRAIALYFVLWLALPLSAADKPLIPRDKVWHFAAGFFISFNVGTMKPKVGLALGCAAGIAKEVYDSQQAGNHFDAKDLLATSGGALAGYGLSRLLFHRKPKAERATPPLLASAGPSDKFPSFGAATPGSRVRKVAQWKRVECDAASVNAPELQLLCNPFAPGTTGSRAATTPRP